MRAVISVDLSKDTNAGWAAMQWASGMTQREIGKLCGYKTSAQVCMAIDRFIARYSGAALNDPDEFAAGRVSAQTNKRKALVKDAVLAFRKSLERAGV